MKESKKELIEPLLKNGKVYKLKCEKCNSVAVQISQNENIDNICYECGGQCIII